MYFSDLLKHRTAFYLAMIPLMKISMWFVHILSAAGLFLYLLFPSAAVQRYMVTWVEKNYPGFRLSLSRLQPNFPIGLSIASGQLLYQNIPLVRADSIQFSPQPSSLLRPLKRIAFQGSASGGRLNGAITVAKSDSTFQIHAETDIAGIKIEEIPFVRQLNLDGFSGVCDGRIRSGSGGPVAIWLEISECKGEFPSSISGVDSIPGTESLSFQRFQASINYRKGALEIREALFQGPGINGSVSGVISTREPFGNSLLKLEGKITDDRRLAGDSDDRSRIRLLSEKSTTAGGADFKIEGTLKNPIFSISHQP